MAPDYPPGYRPPPTMPIKGEAERRVWIEKTDRCPDCNKPLDVGYECNAFYGGCGLDALPIVQS